jgi:hypothetical protein
MWDARVQLHWAAQVPAGVGRTLVARREDDSNTAFAWRDGALWQEPVDGRRAGIRLRDLTLLVDEHEFPLAGRTLDEGFAFLETKFGAKLKRPDVDLPAHPVQHGARFDTDPAKLEILAGYYAGAASILEKIKDGPVLCWPHHFDIATLHALGGGKTIGVGFAPGDDAIREPYWYVNVWPYPDPSRLAPLRLGAWHTEGWTGAVLPAAEGPLRAAAFVADAFARCRALLA